MEGKARDGYANYCSPFVPMFLASPGVSCRCCVVFDAVACSVLEILFVDSTFLTAVSSYRFSYLFDYCRLQLNVVSHYFTVKLFSQLHPVSLHVAFIYSTKRVLISSSC